MRKLCIVLLAVLGLSPVLNLAAQDAVAVPDVTGLTVPQAAAELNRAGLRLGNQNDEGWSPDSGLSANTISEQSVAVGTTAAPGTTVDVTVLRSPTVALLYEDEDLTVINLTDATLSLTGLSFAAVEGNSASFAASRWSRWAVALEQGECAQVWSVGRTGPKAVDGCQSIYWLTTNNPQEHFWTGSNGVARFSVELDGVERAVCDAAPAGSQDHPLRCEAFIPGAGVSDEVTPYIYFAYTPQAFAVIDRSPDKWMPTAQTTIFNYNPHISVPGASLVLGDPALFKSPDIVADITQLAPGQCLLLTSDNPDGAPPEPCDVIASRDLSSDVAFWLASFQIDSTVDDVRRQCPAAVADKTTICVMPR
jgi:hypothetical protein